MMKRVEKTHLPVAALTHPGMKGKNNEDRFGVSAFRLKTQPETPVLLAVLSDGIGGNRAGEVASELAVNLISQTVADSDGRNPPQILSNAIQLASEHIFIQAQANPDQQGMGATCACVWIAGDRLFTATVGDSRIYLMRSGTIYQLSTDHTWIQEALDRGLIQPDQVNGHPNAHVIRRYLGSPTPPEVDFRIRFNGNEANAEPKINNAGQAATTGKAKSGGQSSSASGTGLASSAGQTIPTVVNKSASLANQGLRLLDNDLVLLCSDGLTDLVSADEILAAFGDGTLEEAGQKLIDLANQRGGHDNITLVAIQIPDLIASTEVVAAPVRKTHSRTFFAGCLGIILLAVLVGGVAGGWLLYSDNKATPTPTSTATMTSTPLPTGPTRTPTLTRTPSPTPQRLVPFASFTPTLAPVQGIAPTLTPWPTNTPALPVVTVSH
jgi:PPM family protein phosphatase